MVIHNLFNLMTCYY